MKNSLKIRNVKAAIEHILLYGSEWWTIYSTMRKQIDGYYNRLLIMTTHIYIYIYIYIYISWKDKVTNTQMYKGMPNIADVIKLEDCDQKDIV